MRLNSINKPSACITKKKLLYKQKFHGNRKKNQIKLVFIRKMFIVAVNIRTKLHGTIKKTNLLNMPSNYTSRNIVLFEIKYLQERIGPRMLTTLFPTWRLSRFLRRQDLCLPAQFTSWHGGSTQSPPDDSSSKVGWMKNVFVEMKTSYL